VASPSATIRRLHNALRDLFIAFGAPAKRARQATRGGGSTVQATRDRCPVRRGMVPGAAFVG